MVLKSQAVISKEYQRGNQNALFSKSKAAIFKANPKGFFEIPLTITLALTEPSAEEGHTVRLFGGW